MLYTVQSVLSQVLRNADGTANTIIKSAQGVLNSVLTIDGSGAPALAIRIDNPGDMELDDTNFDGILFGQKTLQEIVDTLDDIDLGGSNPDLPDENTLLLCHFNNNFEDSSGKNVCTPGNRPVLTANQKKFGDTSVYFPGNSYIDINTISNFDFSDSEFTIDFWLRPSAIGIWVDLIGNWEHTGSDVSWVVGYDTDYKLSFGYTITGVLGDYITCTWTTQTLTLDTWQHIAIVRDKTSEIFRIFKDGVEQTVDNASILNSVSIHTPTTYLFRIGARTNQLNYYYKGYIDELRISNIARWTDDFTPPTSPY